MWLLYVQQLGDSTVTGFCVPLLSIRLNCQLMPKLETKHILQAQVLADISTKNGTGNQWYIIKSAKPSTLKSFGNLNQKIN